MNNLLSTSPGSQESFDSEVIDSDIQSKVDHILTMTNGEEFASAEDEIARMEELARTLTDGEDEFNELMDAVSLQHVDNGLIRSADRGNKLKEAKGKVTKFRSRVDQVATGQWNRDDAGFNQVLHDSGFHPESEPPPAM